MTISAEEEGPTVVALPVTHTQPTNPQFAVEIPAPIKRRLGLDDERSRVVLTEANRFVWPGPDLRPTKPGDASSVACGPLPYKFFEQIRLGFIQTLKDRRASAVSRTD
jgi:hypothetical protein